MATAPPTRGPYLNINTQLANSLGTSPLSPAYMPGTPVYTPSMARSVLLWYKYYSGGWCTWPTPLKYPESKSKSNEA